MMSHFAAKSQGMKVLGGVLNVLVIADDVTALKGRPFKPQANGRVEALREYFISGSGPEGAR